MTTPTGAVTSSWGGVLTPPQVAALLNALIGGSPFADSLTRAPTATGRIAFPTVGPTGFAWLAELEPVPSVLLADKALIVATCKVAGVLPVSSEMFSDAAVNITTWVSGALADSLSRDLDLGLLNGTGAPQPDGIIAQATAASGTDLTDAASTAIAEIGEAGGAANTIALSPTLYAAELTARDTQGRLLHPDGLDAIAGLSIVQVPAITPPLVYDSSRCYLVLGQDSTVTPHDDWQHDALALLVKARANVGVPVKAKALRKLTITGGTTREKRQAVSTPDPVRAGLSGQPSAADAKVLLDALAAAGVSVEADDEAALQAVVAAGPEVAATVADWIVDAASGGADTT